MSSVAELSVGSLSGSFVLTVTEFSTVPEVLGWRTSVTVAIAPAAKLRMRQSTPLLPDRLQVPLSDVTDTNAAEVVQLSLKITPEATAALLYLT